MRRRDLLEKAVLAGVGIVAAPLVNRGRCRLFAGVREYSIRAVDLVSHSAVVDMLGLLTLDWPKLDAWHADPARFTAADARKLRDSGITVFHPAVQLNQDEPCAAAERCFWLWNRFLESHPGDLLRIDSAAGIELARQTHRTGVMLGLQNSDHFRSASDVAFFHALGQRISQLTYNGANLIGCGCGERRDTGLTAFGAEIVQAMNRAGMAIDVSHAGERTTLDAIAASARPILITHSNCRALVPHPRCKSDAVIRAMAARGSVMGLTGIRMFVSRSEPATLHDLLDHYDHVARLVGVEHLGIGSDSDPDGRDSAARGRRRVPLEISGINHSRRIFDLTEGLLRRGYTDRHVELILGGNVRRVLGEICA
ncbi:MAG TPA: membrane dipeptidase [Bryobacteraceae bacterium]|nr:membrane dipeptidase [Bryobacteraceae bacterium]